MKEFCENEYCENPGAKVVPVSVDKPSDQRRTLCAPLRRGIHLGRPARQDHQPSLRPRCRC